MAALRVWRNAGVAQTGGGMIGSPQIKISAIALRRCRNLDTSVNLESARSQTGACLPPSGLPNHHTTRYVLLHLVRLMKAGIIPLPDHVLVRCLLLFFRRRLWCK